MTANSADTTRLSHEIEKLKAGGYATITWNISDIDALYAERDRFREALERILHARRDPASPVTDMSRAGMREIAAEALDLGSDETSKWQALQS